MKKVKLLTKFKKIIIVIMCFITLVFSMPVKAKASIIEDFVNLLLGIPDAIMCGADIWIAGSTEFTSFSADGKGWGMQGRIYNFCISPYEIFSSASYKDTGDTYETGIGLFDINFFADKPIVATNEKSEVSSNILAPVIGNIYKSLRNLCLVLMMLVLLYIGIKILMSSVSSEKAKYKQMLMDWLVGFCLLFIMHYIMSFIININSVIVKMLSNNAGDSYFIGIAELQDNGYGTDSTWLDIVTGEVNDFNDSKYEHFLKTQITVEGTEDDEVNYKLEDESTGKVDLNKYSNIRYKGESVDLSKWGNNGVIYLALSIVNSSNDNIKYANKAIMRANIMEYARMISSFGLDGGGENLRIYSGGNIHDATSSSETDNVVPMAYSILYLALVVETIMFSVIYIKRVLQMSFLTMVAPIVAIMYPIDKIGDGKAQAFNTWFKDYLFNVLIQPMHLLLYTIFIVAAGELFQRNVVYALAIYAFMIPAEKYFKNLLGFQKSSNGGGGGFAGALGAGALMGGFKSLTGLGPGPSGKGKPGSGGGKDGAEKSKIRKLKLNNKPSQDSQGDAPGGAGGKFKNSAQRAGSKIGQGLKKFAGTGVGKSIGSGINIAGRRILGAATGGKYNQLKGVKGRKIGLAVAKTGGRLAAKGLGGLSMGAAGLIAGTASAMVTGNASDIWKGAGIGVTAGLKQFGNAYDGITNAGGSFINDTKQLRAENDDIYAGKLRTENELEAFKGENLKSNEIEAIKECAPYMDFGGDKNKVKAVAEARDNGASLEQILQTESDSSSWGDLKKDSNKTSYMNYQTQERMSQIDESKIQIDQAEIEKKAKIKKKEEIEAAKKKHDEAVAKRDEEIANAKSAGNVDRANKLERKREQEQREFEKEISNAQKAKYDSAAAEKALRDEEKQKRAEQQANEDYQRALRFQETSKKNSK